MWPRNESGPVESQAQPQTLEKGGLLILLALLRQGLPQLIHKVLPQPGPDGIQVPGNQSLAGGAFGIGDGGKVFLSQRKQVGN